MDIHPATAVVRRRLFSAAPGFVAFAAIALAATPHTWKQSWFFVGLGIVLSATFLEPHFSSPRAAIANAAGGLGACIGAEKAGLTSLWTLLAVFFAVVAVAAIVASTMGPGRFSGACKRFSSRFGRASAVGTAVLFLIVITDADLHQSGVEYMAIAAAILVASVTFDWATLFSQLVGAAESATAVGVVGPRMLLVAGAPGQFLQGDPVILRGPNGKPVAGSVVARIPHVDGLRYQIALAEEWTAICAAFPAAVTLQGDKDDGDLAGAVGAGSTHRLIQFEPSRSLDIGDPLVIREANRDLLYQVARLRLENSAWPGSTAVVPSATAHLVGWPTDNHVRSVSHLPSPHEPVYRASGLPGGLDEAHYEIGCIKGTEISIGLRTDEERRGHIAILGMSGMGKTAVAQRICSTLGQDHVVVALDTTGEYQSRLGFSTWTSDDYDTAGHFVYAPAGDPPDKAASFIEACMQAGAAEYAEGNQPKRRVILLEEAHTFLPEWNVALRAQQERVAFSTRMIMQARKFGLTFIVVSQRTAVVSKSALSQCENYIILKTLDHTGLEYLESLVGPEMRDAIPSLERFEAMCVGPAFNADEPVIVSLAAP